MSGTAKEGVSGRSTEVARLVSYLVLIAAALALFVAAGDLPSSRWEPLGAGAFPRLVLGVLAGLGVLAALDAARRIARGGGGARSPDVAAWLRRHRLVLALFVLFAAYLASMQALGFPLATFAFLLLAQLLLAPATWTARAVVLVIAIVFSFGLNALFAEVFRVFLPRGGLFG